ncbi:GNAT domain-containing protein [Cercophora newfieldiana]|uniref:GNAT domain-containing protein n=1 Tax=Cercophora newfieldiana TaxID=92897 RepID=A0AA39YRG5_9PEZI|nr:GNAT domain-containing protein [Cercophora newfieldiana]
MSSTEPTPTTKTEDDGFVVVKTTRPVSPFPHNEERQPIVTERLILRVFRPEDIDGLRELRTQPEVMKWTMQGRVDGDMAETQARLDPFLGESALGSYNFAITLRGTGELIGLGGCHNFCSSQGWPEMGYMFKTQHWGKGLATEFLKGFVERWRTLPREEVELKVKEASVIGGEEGRAREVLVAITDEVNWGSKKVLEKNGFERFLEWKGAGQDVTLVGWRLRMGGEEGRS